MGEINISVTAKKEKGVLFFATHMVTATDGEFNVDISHANGLILINVNGGNYYSIDITSILEAIKINEGL